MGCAQILSNAHAHNDYQRNKPLFSAIDNGIPSIEVDVFLHDNKIVVAHHAIALSCRPSFEESYLIPLIQRVEKNNGKVFLDSTPLILMIDLKRNKDSLTLRLYDLLLKYKNLIRSKSTPNSPLIIMLSGHPTIQLIRSLEHEIFVVDGNLCHLEEHVDVDFIPRVSMNYRKTFSWRGMGKMNQKDSERLKTLVEQATKNRQKLRFWSMPNRRRIWYTFSKYPEVIINIDRYKKFKKFSDNLDSLQSENGHQ